MKRHVNLVSVKKTALCVNEFFHPNPENQWLDFGARLFRSKVSTEMRIMELQRYIEKETFKSENTNTCDLNVK